MTPEERAEKILSRLQPDQDIGLSDVFTVRANRNIREQKLQWIAAEIREAVEEQKQ